MDVSLDGKQTGSNAGPDAAYKSPGFMRPLHNASAMPRLRNDRIRLTRMLQDYEASPPKHLAADELLGVNESIRRRIEFLNREIEKLEELKAA
jgi:hypothetical protein